MRTQKKIFPLVVLLKLSARSRLIWKSGGLFSLHVVGCPAGWRACLTSWSWGLQKTYRWQAPLEVPFSSVSAQVTSQAPVCFTNRKTISWNEKPNTVGTVPAMVSPLLLLVFSGFPGPHVTTRCAADTVLPRWISKREYCPELEENISENLEYFHGQYPHQLW